MSNTLATRWSALSEGARSGIIVVCGGMLGGFLSWVYSVAVGENLRLPTLPAILSSIALGAGASWVGIYVIANSDTKQIHRCFGFAILCGISWKPVYDAGKALINQSTQRKQEDNVAQLINTSQDIIRELGSSSAQDLPKYIQSAEVTATELATSTAQLGDVQKQQKALDAQKKLIAQLGVVSVKAPEESATAISVIGALNADSGHPAIAAVALRCLKDLAPEYSHPKLVPVMYKSLTKIGQAADAGGVRRTGI